MTRGARPVPGARRRAAANRAALLASALVFAGCGFGREVDLVVATDLPGDLLDHVEAVFEDAHPEVDVRFIDGAAGIERALAGTRAPATSDGPPDDRVDVFWGVDGVELERLALEGRLVPNRPGWLGAIEAEGRDDERTAWQPLLVTPFVIAFDRERVPIARAPADWIDLFHHRWTTEVVVLDPSASAEGAYFAGAMVVEALRDDDDLNRGFDWLARVDRQARRYVASPGDALRALDREEGMIAIVPRAAVEEARHGSMPSIHYRLPQSGTPMLALGVAVVSRTSDEALARSFVELVGSDLTVTEARLLTRWDPVHGRVDESRVPSDFELPLRGERYALATDTLATELDGWVDRWDRDIRTGPRR